MQWSCSSGRGCGHDEHPSRYQRADRRLEADLPLPSWSRTLIRHHPIVRRTLMTLGPITAPEQPIWPRSGWAADHRMVRPPSTHPPSSTSARSFAPAAASGPDAASQPPNSKVSVRSSRPGFSTRFVQFCGVCAKSIDESPLDSLVPTRLLLVSDLGLGCCPVAFVEV